MPKLEAKIPPPIILLVCMANAFALKLLLPGADFETGTVARSYVIVILVALAFLILAFALWPFLHCRTTVNPHNLDSSRVLLTRGVFRLSRNPIYLGLLVLLIAWCLYLANILSISQVPLFIFIINRFQIIPEERALERQFPGQYSHYKETVRRWL